MLIQIQDILHKIEVDQKKIVFMWVRGNVAIRGNEAADRAAKEALNKEPTDDLMPFSDLKPLNAKSIHQVWQKEWDEAVIIFNKLHELSDKLLLFCKTRKEDTVLHRHSYLTHPFLLKKKRSSCLCCVLVSTLHKLEWSWPWNTVIHVCRLVVIRDLVQTSAAIHSIYETNSVPVQQLKSVKHTVDMFSRRYP